MVTGTRGRLYQESDGGNRFLELDEGWQYDIPLGTDNWRRIKYQRNDSALSNVQSEDDDDPAHAMPTATLIHAIDPDSRSEFAGRITAPFMVLVLIMLALPMSRQSPREPRYGRLLLAVLTFFVYHALLAICQAQIAKGHWHRSLSLWLVDGLLFAIAAWMFQRQYAVRKSPSRPA
ncbi:permease [Lasius niger]|uniref:Permease n=1 Tax=Lasius niger TaxID=67767 RepID=A0A0J7JVD9_LASNI|nr:permease [Lasius niger]